MVIRLVNMLGSGRCASLGRGGLGGGLAYRVRVGLSGSSMSTCREFLDAAGEFGDDILACIDDKGSAMIGGGNDL
jgi:hypothetical protein